MMITHTLCSSNKLFSSPPFPNSPKQKQKNGCYKDLDPKVVDPCAILITPYSLVSSLTDHSHSLQQQQALLFSSLLFSSPQKQKNGASKNLDPNVVDPFLSFSSPTHSLFLLSLVSKISDRCNNHFQMLGACRVNKFNTISPPKQTDNR
jgi:hypothetical protein